MKDKTETIIKQGIKTKLEENDKHILKSY